MKKLLILLLAIPIAGCATTRAGSESAGRDPYERLNRGVWAFNDAADTVLIKPATTVYRTVTPCRRGVGSAGSFEPRRAV
jgi:phospholipid-binding lipoprotein MlaA